MSQTAFDKLVRPAAWYTGGEGEIIQFEEVESTELNGVEEGEASDEVEGYGKLAPPDWRVRA